MLGRCPAPAPRTPLIRLRLPPDAFPGPAAATAGTPWPASRSSSSRSRPSWRPWTGSASACTASDEAVGKVLFAGGSGSPHPLRNPRADREVSRSSARSLPQASASGRVVCRERRRPPRRRAVHPRCPPQRPAGGSRTVRKLASQLTCSRCGGRDIRGDRRPRGAEAGRRTSRRTEHDPHGHIQVVAHLGPRFVELVQIGLVVGTQEAPQPPALGVVVHRVHLWWRSAYRGTPGREADSRETRFGREHGFYQVSRQRLAIRQLSCEEGRHGAVAVAPMPVQKGGELQAGSRLARDLTEPLLVPARWLTRPGTRC
jgi:hypothetical protein